MWKFVSRLSAFLVIFVMFAGSWGHVYGEVGDRESGITTKILGTRALVFENKNCATLGTCSLKRVVFRSDDYAAGSQRDLYSLHFGTMLHASYETDSVDHLKDYVFVQFVKGCACLSFKNKDGDVITLFATKEQFGIRNSDAYYKAFVIDSIDTDPVYNSWPGFERHYHYLWSRDLYHGPNEREEHNKIFGEEKPLYPKLFVMDVPAQASVMKLSDGLIVRDVALEYRTCLYKTKDVPLVTVPSNVNFAKPVVCFDWKSSYVYNWETREFEHPPAIAPICTRARSLFPPQEKK